MIESADSYGFPPGWPSVCSERPPKVSAPAPLFDAVKSIAQIRLLDSTPAAFREEASSSGERSEFSFAHSGTAPPCNADSSRWSISFCSRAFELLPPMSLVWRQTKRDHCVRRWFGVTPQIDSC